MGADAKALPMGSFAALTADPSCLDGLANGERLVVHEIQRRVGGDLSCFPSQGRIAKDSGLSRRWVNRILGDLENKGYIRSRPGEGRRSKTYELVPEKFGLAVSSQPQPVETAENAENAVVPKEPTRAKGFYPAPRQAPDGSADYAEVLRRLGGIEQAIALLTQMVAALSEHRYSTRMRGMGGDLIQTEFVFHEVSETDFLNPPIPAEWNDVPEGVKPAWSAEDCETFTMDIPCPFPPAAPSEASKAENKAGKPEQLLLLPEGGNTSEPAPKPETKPAQKTEQKTEPKPAWNIEDGWRRFWAAYPKHTGEIQAHRNFVTFFRSRANPEAWLQKFLGIIKQMKRTVKWNENNGQYIYEPKNFLGRNQEWKTCVKDLASGRLPMLEDDEDEDANYDPSRPQCLQRSPAADAELVTGMETGRPANAPAAPKPVRQWTPRDWMLCSERCKHYDPEKVCCRCGVKVPPEHDPCHVRPPEECKHFERIEGEEPPPRTLDELMNESTRPALRTGVRGVKSLASVFGGVLSSMGSQA